MNPKIIANKDYIKSSSGISKRLYLAFIDLIEKNPDVENILFQLCSVVESTAKSIYVTERRSKQRFLNYINDNQEDLLFIYSGGIKIKLDGFFDKTQNKRFSIAEILYNVRCCNYHDPEELKNYIEINHTVKGFGLSKLNSKFAYCLFLLLFSETSNKDKIDKELFNGVGKLGDIPLFDLIGNRTEILKIFSKNMNVA